MRRREMVPRRWIGPRVLRSRGRACRPSTETVAAGQRNTIMAMSGSAGHPKRRIGWTVAIGKQLDHLLSGRSQLVKDVGADDCAIRVRYEIRLPILERPTPIDSTWVLHGTDDLGSQYESAGEAFGLSAQLDHTRPVRRIVLPFTGQAISQRAFDAAVRLAKAENATIMPAYLARVPRNLPLEAPLPAACAVGMPLLDAIEQAPAHRAFRWMRAWRAAAPTETRSTISSSRSASTASSSRRPTARAMVSAARISNGSSNAFPPRS
jgi:hypothetical protein